MHHPILKIVLIIIVILVILWIVQENNRRGRSRIRRRIRRRLSSWGSDVESDLSDLEDDVESRWGRIFRRNRSRSRSDSRSRSRSRSWSRSRSSSRSRSRSRSRSWSPSSSSSSRSDSHNHSRGSAGQRCNECGQIRNEVGTCACTCVCTASKYDGTLFPGVQYTKLGTSQVLTNPQVGMTVTAYGFTNAGVATELSTRGNQGVGEVGMGCWSDLFSNAVDDNSIHEIDNQHFVQLDVTQIQPFVNNSCGAPTISIGSVQSGESFALYGSDTLGTKGTLLYSFTGTATSNILQTVPLFNPANVATPTLYKYISVTAFPAGTPAQGGDIVLVNITLNSCQF